MKYLSGAQMLANLYSSNKNKKNKNKKKQTNKLTLFLRGKKYNICAVISLMV